MQTITIRKFLKSARALSTSRIIKPSMPAITAKRSATFATLARRYAASVTGCDRYHCAAHLKDGFHCAEATLRGGGYRRICRLLCALPRP